MDKIMKRISFEGDCWIWTGCLNSDGYPKLARNKNFNVKGHRYVYEQLKGEVPEGHVVRHTCDNPLCLNPDHLLTGTPTDNMKDRQSRERTNNFISDEVTEKIKDLRSTGLSQSKVAAIVGCHQTHISKLERGKYTLKG